ncbi:S-layer homology domain-containing protein [bacterium]|nr:S-layer homology domain-containing protein [bacterium]
MKKLLSIFAVIFALVASQNVFADVYKDVPADYWANKEITGVVKWGILDLQKGKFNPESLMTRSDFNSALLRTLGHPTSTVSPDNKFSDVDSSRKDYSDILLSESIGLIYGYNDGTFRPDNNINKAETASIISHITKDRVSSTAALAPFADKNDVPSWAKRQYAKTIDLGVYVNYPDENYLLPVKELNRAEAAVLLYKLKLKLDAVKEQYVAQETLLGVEHLSLYKKAANNEVKVTNLRNIILSGNVIKGYFNAYYNSKKSSEGDEVVFVAKKDIYSDEGTLLIPQGTTMLSKVNTLQEQRWFNKNAEVTLDFVSMTLPNGRVLPFSARVLDNDGILTRNWWVKPLTYTVAGAAVGTGTSIAITANNEQIPEGLAVGIPVGAGVGAVAGFVTKGLAYKADENDSLWLELTQDLSIPKN